MQIKGPREKKICPEIVDRTYIPCQRFPCKGQVIQK